MIIYGDLYKRSGVSHYSIAEDCIRVKFKNGNGYVYTNIKPGKIHVDKMKELALSGNGLNAYINKYVRFQYASKF